ALYSGQGFDLLNGGTGDDFLLGGNFGGSEPDGANSLRERLGKTGARLVRLARYAILKLA
ncbi:MAG: hypothetical protein AAGI37_21570, partial [Planctomycetota bacterium]